MTETLIRGSLRPGDCVIVYTNKVRAVAWFVLAVEHDRELTKVFWLSVNPETKTKFVEGVWNLSNEILNDTRAMVILKP